MKTNKNVDSRDTSKRRARTKGYTLPAEVRQKIAALIEDIDRASRQLDEAQRRIARHRIARY